MTVKVLAAAALAAAVALSGCSGDGGQQPAAGSTSASAASTPSQGGSGEHNQADVSFAQQMIPHHAQAIEMSDIVLGKQGIDPRVVALANEIKAAQQPEIDQLQGWLTQWGQSAPSTSPNMDVPGTPGHGATPTPGGGHGTPGGGHGMMSQQDLEALRNAQGVEASRLFLTQMIAHHQGAIAMAQTEIDTGQFAPAVELARSIITSQQAEITKMQEILNSL